MNPSSGSLNPYFSTMNAQIIDRIIDIMVDNTRLADIAYIHKKNENIRSAPIVTMRNGLIIIMIHTY